MAKVQEAKLSGKRKLDVEIENITLAELHDILIDFEENQDDSIQFQQNWTYHVAELIDNECEVAGTIIYIPGVSAKEV